jgi:hypothetical protein
MASRSRIASPIRNLPGSPGLVLNLFFMSISISPHNLLFLVLIPAWIRKGESHSSPLPFGLISIIRVSTRAIDSHPVALEVEPHRG